MNSPAENAPAPMSATPATPTFAALLEARRDGALLALATEAPNRCDSDGETALEAAIEARRADLCRKLLELGCDPDFSLSGTDPLELCLQPEFRGIWGGERGGSHVLAMSWKVSRACTNVPM